MDRGTIISPSPEKGRVRVGLILNELSLAIKIHVKRNYELLHYAR
jgi:hypothetical protein